MPKRSFPATKRHIPITARGFATLITGGVSLTAGILLGAGGFTVFGIVLLALVPVALVTLYLLPQPVTVTRECSSHHITVGDTTEVTLTLSSTSWLLVGGVWSETLPEGLVASDIDGHVTLRGRSPRVIRYELTGVARGVHNVGPLKLTSTDAFGMARRTRTLRNGPDAKFTVTPRIVPLTLTTGSAGVSGDSRSSAEHRSEQQVADLVPRPFAPGDSRRRVHWRASARLGELMVRQEEPHTHRTAVIVLDLTQHRWSGSVSENTQHLDAAVTLAASLAAHYVRHGFTVRVVDDASSVLADVSAGGLGLDSLLIALAAVHPADRAEPMTVADLFHHSRDDVVSLITGAWHASDSASLPVRRPGSAHLYATHPDPTAKAPAESLGWTTGRVSRMLGTATPSTTAHATERRRRG